MNAHRDATARTALGPMTLAAIEHNEPPDRRLVDDDLAESFLPTRSRLLVRLTRIGWLRRAVLSASERAAPGVAISVACRKRFIDERLSDPLNETDVVIVLGAGLDTRGCRIARHGDLPVYEVDQPEVVEHKAAVLRRVAGTIPSSIHLVGADLETDDLMAALESHGFRLGQRAFVIWEGVTQYLSDAAIRATLEALRGLAPGSRLIFSYVRQDFLDGTNRYGADALYRRFRQRSQLWQSGMVPEQVADLLAEYGWRLVEQVGPSYYRDTYIRPTGRPLAASAIEWTALAER
ncbi:SAM-dependent methyltransferase [Mycobacterium sp. SMC-4]|uniref:SAM-dependent methyltransferase n=1 Tax=Mycobacterium sp. SMC-4 TaxID=2857059 RepID=UPI0021B3B2DF|nr:SAM-dependent methyltransferase [Mycobacterium sp. SMC-4]UXA19959.1 SAM-dependent methyltransferase [Mycobacterium sp. SMC-4]